MNTLLLRTYLLVKQIIGQEDGQDLVEYALIVALIALSAAIGMKNLAGGINHAFNSVSVALATDI
ncbi:MAG: Flp family type IVb pilin [Terracidiphilus sp.]|jgi:pilus assembly protein Flp/PilA